MNHKNEQEMMFHLLSGINYNQSWEKIDYGLGYDLGDYAFHGKETHDKVRKIARLIHCELEGVFNDEGNPSAYSDHFLSLVEDGWAKMPE